MNDLKTLLRVAEIDPSVPALDVHGMRVNEARHEVDFFIDKLFREKIRIGKIIHGKGEDILSRDLPRFLKEHAQVECVHTPAGTYETGAVIYVSLIL